MSELHKADGRSWRNAPCGGRPWGIPSPSMQLGGEADDQRREQIESTDRGPAPRLTQVAFSVVDLAATERWFREGLGFWPAGGARRRMRGPLASAVQGLPRVASTCWWMVDRNEFFQLELFQFERPLARLMAHDFRPCDIGYRGSASGWPTSTRRWHDWRAWAHRRSPTRRARRDASRVRAQPRRRLRRDHGGRPAVGRRTRPRADRPAPSPCARSRCRSPTWPGPRPSSRADSGWSAPMPRCEHQSTRRSGVCPARGRAARVFTAGGVLVELVQYLDPVGRPRPADYRISDQGILNIAFGARSRRDHVALYRRARAAGAQPNCRPLHCPARASSTSPTRSSSRSSCCGCPRRRTGAGASRRGRPPSGRGPTRTPSSGRCGSPRPRRPRGM